LESGGTKKRQRVCVRAIRACRAHDILARAFWRPSAESGLEEGCCAAIGLPAIVDCCWHESKQAADYHTTEATLPADSQSLQRKESEQVQHAPNQQRSVWRSSTGANTEARTRRKGIAFASSHAANNSKRFRRFVLLLDRTAPIE